MDHRTFSSIASNSPFLEWIQQQNAKQSSVPSFGFAQKFHFYELDKYQQFINLQSTVQKPMFILFICFLSMMLVLVPQQCHDALPVPYACTISIPNWVVQQDMDCPRIRFMGYVLYLESFSDAQLKIYRLIKVYYTKLDHPQFQI